LKIVCYELARAYAFEWSTRRDMLSEAFRALVMRGLDTSWDDYVSAQTVGSHAKRWIDGTFTQTDLWLTASAPGEAPVGMGTGDPVLNRLWSMLHLPVMTVPAGRGPANLPLGVQLIGRFRGDAQLIRMARWVESSLAA
jgi:amidase